MPLLLALGIPTALGVIAFVYFKRTLDAPDAPIVVVDRRTMRLAQHRIDEALDAGQRARANAGMTALIKWLRYEIRTGPARHRIAYASLLEKTEARKAKLLADAGMPGYKV